MNILRLSTFSLLTMMLIPIGAYAHCEGKHSGNHPHCSGGGGGGGGGDDATYSVEIVGDNLAGNSFASPPWHEGGRKNSISGQQHNSGFLTDLSIFESIFNTMVGDPSSATQGAVCFPPDTDFLIEAATIGQKKGRAEAGFWFKANTFEGGRRFFISFILPGTLMGRGFLELEN